MPPEKKFRYDNLYVQLEFIAINTEKRETTVHFMPMLASLSLKLLN